MRRPLRSLLGTIAKLLLGLAILVIAVVGYGIHSNYRAVRAAERFCAQIALGSDLAHIVQAARASGIRYIEPLHVFYFQGWVFNGAVCAVTVDGDRVLSKRVEVRDD